MRRILYGELSESGTTGGSHQCLYDMVRHLDRERFAPVVLFYEPNVFAERLRGLGFQVLTWREERARERLALGGVLRRPRLAVRQIGAIERRARLIREERIDLVHLNNSPILAADDWLPAARLTRRPIVTHCRAAFRPVDGRLRPWLSRRFDRVIAISGNVAEALRRARVPADRISRVYDGIDVADVLARARSAPEETRCALGVPPGDLLVLMVGHLRSWKGQHVLLDALEAIAVADRARLRVVFAGDVDAVEAPYAERLRARVAAGGLERSVSFLGPRGDVPDLMNAADVVVHASVIPEPLGLVVLEGMAFGKPVVASCLGGPSETVTPESGLLFNPARPQELAAHLRRLAAEPDLRRSLGEGGRERVKSFGIEANVQAIQAIYDDLLARA